MRTVRQWLAEYDACHRNSTNKLIHWLCVPAIMFSIMGLAWCLPAPALFAEVAMSLGLPSSWPLNWAVILAAIALLYYVYLSAWLALGMLLVLAGMLALMLALQQAGAPIGALSIGLFIIAWAVQFIGHEIEGKRPAFFKDVQFLMIGPLWLLAFVYRKLGIAY